MATTMKDLVAEVRSMLTGTLTNEITLLAQDYTAGSPQVVLQYPKRNLSVGSLLCCGANTWQVLAVSSDGGTIDVYAQADGGPDVDMPQGSLVQVRPRHTDWSIFREINGEIVGMSSPANGLYGTDTFYSVPDWVSGTYTLPTAWTKIPLSLLLVRYQRYGVDSWQIVRNVEWQPENQAVRIYGDQPNAEQIEFTLAFPFTTANSPYMDDTLDSLGLNEYVRDIPTLGAAANLLRAVEGRRQQVQSQGDPRRAEEVSAGANIGLAREWDRKQKQRIDEEAARLVRQYGYQQTVWV